MDSIELKLPVSGQTVTIRNYTTRNDDEKSEAILYMGVHADQKSSKGGEEQSVKFPLSNVMASQEVYVRRLVVSIDGDTSNLVSKLGELRTADYTTLRTAVDEVVNTNSPKAKTAKPA